MSILWEKSQTWRWLVTKTRDSKPFFLAFATVCGVVPGVIGYCVMQVTNSRNPELEEKLRKSARPESMMMGKVNQERLAEYLGELKRKEDTNDRYVAALRGETLTRKPYVRIQPVSSDEDKKRAENGSEVGHADFWFFDGVASLSNYMIIISCFLMYLFVKLIYI